MNASIEITFVYRFYDALWRFTALYDALRRFMALYDAIWRFTGSEE